MKTKETIPTVSLADIRSPEELKKVPAQAIPTLCEEIRRFLIAHVEQTGGHLASNLGVVELTVALHRVFSSPRDHIIFDVGHQSYVHKLLTGRQDAFASLRTPGGLSGFPSRWESEHDAFGTGHSSTAFSAALGFAEADRICGSDAYTVAVIGDGAFTGGMVHEAMNNCRKGVRLVIVLNENEMSISRNIGKFAAAISRMRLSRRYNRTKRRTQNVLTRIPLIGMPVSRLLTACKKKAKNAMFGSNLFENLGFFYIGPVDGNREDLVELALAEAKRRRESVIVHIKTRKGCGYPPALSHPEEYHSIPAPGSTAAPAFHRVVGDTLTAMAEQDRKVCAITAAMGCGTGLDVFAERCSNRYFDVGIAEEHAATFAAGLAAAGMKPYFAVYSTFLQRAYDNLVHDIATQELPVRLLVDRASLAVADGVTHHGVFDVAFLSHIPHFRIFAPATFGSLKCMLWDSLHATSPIAIRYPNCSENADICRAFYPNGDYQSYGVRCNFIPSDSPEAVILTYGKIAAEALRAESLLQAQGIRTGSVLLETLAPYGELAAQILPLLPADCRVLFLEEGIYDGGAGMLLGARFAELQPDFFARHRWQVLAIRESFAVQKAPGAPYAVLGISAEDVVQTITK